MLFRPVARISRRGVCGTEQAMGGGLESSESTPVSESLRMALAITSHHKHIQLRVSIYCNRALPIRRTRIGMVMTEAPAETSSNPGKHK